MLEEIKYKLKRKLFRQMEAYDITLDELKEKQMTLLICIQELMRI